MEQKQQRRNKVLARLLLAQFISFACLLRVCQAPFHCADILAEIADFAFAIRIRNRHKALALNHAISRRDMDPEIVAFVDAPLGGLPRAVAERDN